MENKKNIIYIIISLAALILFICISLITSGRDADRAKELMSKTQEYNDRIEKEKADIAEKRKRTEEILKRTPGIACWGNGITYGTNGDGSNYPYELESLIKSKGYPYSVQNMGVYGEDSLTVLGRMGAIPFVIAENFNIEGTQEDLIPIKLTSEKGEEVNPCIRDYNPGFNPCLVAGRECVIYGATSASVTDKATGYYFNRQDNKLDKVEIPKGTVIQTNGMREYKDYIHIIQVSDGGGYSDDDELYEQELSVLDYIGNSNKYIIIGRLSGSQEDNEYLDKKLADKFGRHYLNVRELLCQKEIEGAKYTSKDKEEMAEGKIPSCLKKEDYLNSKGYKALGNMLYERLKSLNIILK